MDRKFRLLVAFMCLVLVSIFAVNGFCADLNFGDPMGSYMGVVAKSNGGNIKEYYQCAEYVKRFFNDIYHIGPFGIDAAREYYTLFEQKDFAKKGVVRFPNNGSVPPGPGDILVFDYKDGIGHVAIVMENTGTVVKIKAL